MKDAFKNIPWAKVGKIAGTVLTVGIAVVSSLGEQKKNQEFDQMKKDLEILKNK